MKKICISLAIILLLFGNANAEKDKSGRFSFTLPEGWEVNNLMEHSMLLNNNPKYDFRGNIIFEDVSSENPLSSIKKEKEEELKKKMNNCEIISSNIIKLNTGKEALRIIFKWGTPKFTFHQVDYVIALNSGERIGVIYSFPLDVYPNETLRKMHLKKLDEFINSIKGL